MCFLCLHGECEPERRSRWVEGWRYHTAKGSPFSFAASPLINRLCTHAHSCQSLRASHYHRDLSFCCPATPSTHKHTQTHIHTHKKSHTYIYIYICQAQVFDGWWMGGWTENWKVNVVDKYNQWALMTKQDCWISNTSKFHDQSLESGLTDESRPPNKGDIKILGVSWNYLQFSLNLKFSVMAISTALILLVRQSPLYRCQAHILTDLQFTFKTYFRSF